MPDTLSLLSSEPIRRVDTAATRSVLVEILDERRHQIDDHGWTPDHDDLHGLEDFAWLIARRAIDMSHRDAVHAVDCRRLFVEIAAIAVAAIEAVDRFNSREVP
jgi:hypothetical protein